MGNADPAITSKIHFLMKLAKWMDSKTPEGNLGLPSVRVSDCLSVRPQNLDPAIT